MAFVTRIYIKPDIIRWRCNWSWRRKSWAAKYSDQVAYAAKF